ncbi:MAG: hypothetical protein AB7F75_09555 [Planctomycetota bacterium]
MRWVILFLICILASCASGSLPDQESHGEIAPPEGELLRRGDLLVSNLRQLSDGFHREEHFAIYRQGELCGMRFCTLDATGAGPTQSLKLEERMAIFTNGSWQVSRAQWNLAHDWKPVSLRLIMRTTQVFQPPSVKVFAMNRDATGFSLAMRKDGKDYNAHIKEPQGWFCSTPELVIPWLQATDKPYSLRTLLFESGDLAEVTVIPHSMEHRDGLSFQVLEMRAPRQTKGEILTVASEPPGALMSRTLLACKGNMKLMTQENIRELRQKFHLPEWPEFPL